MTNQKKTTLTPAEAARKLAVQLDQIYTLVWSGTLPATKHDGRWGIPVEAVNERLKARRVKK